MQKSSAVLTLLLTLSLAGCFKHQHASSSETNADSLPPKVETEIFDLGTKSVDDYKVAITKFQAGDGPLPILPFGQVAFSGQVNIIGSTTIPSAPTGVALRMAVRDAVGNGAAPAIDDETRDAALPRCKVCEGDPSPLPAFGSTPTPTPGASTSPVTTAIPVETDRPVASVTPTTTPDTRVVVVKNQGRNSRFAFGRNCLLGCPAGFFPAVFSFYQPIGNQFFVASVCTDGTQPGVCAVNYANGNRCLYTAAGGYSCALPPVGVSAITGITCF